AGAHRSKLRSSIDRVRKASTTGNHFQIHTPSPPEFLARPVVTPRIFDQRRIDQKSTFFGSTPTTSNKGLRAPEPANKISKLWIWAGLRVNVCGGRFRRLRGGTPVRRYNSRSQSNEDYDNSPDFEGGLYAQKLQGSVFHSLCRQG